MIYLDNAATSRFKPQCMFEAMMRECSESANPGRGTHADALACAARTDAAREGMLSLLGADENYVGVLPRDVPKRSTSRCSDSKAISRAARS